MDDKFLWLKVFFAAIGGFIGYLVGGIDVLIRALAIFIVSDYITGVVAAWHSKTLNSEIGFKGIVRKTMLFVLVALAVQVDIIFKSNNIVRSATIFYILANEGLSILENLARANILVPPILKEAFENMKKLDK